MNITRNIRRNPFCALDVESFERTPESGITADRLSEFGSDQNARTFCIELIVGFLSSITQHISTALEGLQPWQPILVKNSGDTIWSECVCLGAERAGELAKQMQEYAEQGRRGEARRKYGELRHELTFVWEDLQYTLERLRVQALLEESQAEKLD